MHIIIIITIILMMMLPNVNGSDESTLLTFHTRLSDILIRILFSVDKHVSLVSLWAANVSPMIRCGTTEDVITGTFDVYNNTNETWLSPKCVVIENSWCPLWTDPPTSSFILLYVSFRAVSMVTYFLLFAWPYHLIRCADTTLLYLLTPYIFSTSLSGYLLYTPSSIFFFYPSYHFSLIFR